MAVTAELPSHAVYKGRCFKFVNGLIAYECVMPFLFSKNKYL